MKNMKNRQDKFKDSRDTINQKNKFPIKILEKIFENKLNNFKTLFWKNTIIFLLNRQLFSKNRKISNGNRKKNSNEGRFYGLINKNGVIHIFRKIMGNMHNQQKFFAFQKILKRDLKIITMRKILENWINFCNQNNRRFFQKYFLKWKNFNQNSKKYTFFSIFLKNLTKKQFLLLKVLFFASLKKLLNKKQAIQIKENKYGKFFIAIKNFYTRNLIFCFNRLVFNKSFKKNTKLNSMLKFENFILKKNKENKQLFFCSLLDFLSKSIYLFLNNIKIILY